MAAEIRKALGLGATLEKGRGGIFDVYAPDGRRVFSKHEEHRFPEGDELVELLR